MKKTESYENSYDIEAIVNKMKLEIREGVAGKKMSINDIDRKMSAAYEQIRVELAKQVGEVIQEELDTEATECPECKERLKKTEK